MADSQKRNETDIYTYIQIRLRWGLNFIALFIFSWFYWLARWFTAWNDFVDEPEIFPFLGHLATYRHLLLSSGVALAFFDTFALAIMHGGLPSASWTASGDISYNFRMIKVPVFQIALPGLSANQSTSVVLCHPPSCRAISQLSISHRLRAWRGFHLGDDVYRFSAMNSASPPMTASWGVIIASDIAYFDNADMSSYCADFIRDIGLHFGTTISSSSFGMKRRICGKYFCVPSVNIWRESDFIWRWWPMSLGAWDASRLSMRCRDIFCIACLLGFPANFKKSMRLMHHAYRAL